MLTGCASVSQNQIRRYLIYFSVRQPLLSLQEKLVLYRKFAFYIWGR